MTETPAVGPVLGGLRVLDLAHQYSGAMSAAFMADLGADVISVEHPTKLAIRTMLPRKGDQSLWWKVVQRGKRHVSININTPRGREMVIELAKQADLITENFRPGTLEKWGLGPADLEAAGVSCVMLRISGFGQTGPYSNRPGFGTVAEALSGFASLNGEPDGPPTFPSTTLADGLAAVFGAFGAMAALWSRAKGTAPKGIEVVDMALVEGMLRIIPTQIAAYDQLGKVPERPGNRLTSHGILRDLFKSRDGRWFVISAVGPVPIRRVLVASGQQELAERIDNGAMLQSPTEVIAFLDEGTDGVHAWAAQNDYVEVEKALREGDVVFQVVYRADDIVADEHFKFRNAIIDVPDEDLGPIKMQGIVPRFPQRPHAVKRAGAQRGLDNESVFHDLLGLDDAEIQKLHDEGVV